MDVGQTTRTGGRWNAAPAAERVSRGGPRWYFLSLSETPPSSSPPLLPTEADSNSTFFHEMFSAAFAILPLPHGQRVPRGGLGLGRVARKLPGGRAALSAAAHPTLGSWLHGSRAFGSRLSLPGVGVGG